MAIATWVLLALTGSSALTDILRGRIYNGIVLPAAVTGLALRTLPACGGSASALAEGLGSMALVCALFLPFWMCLPGRIGGGDIKLYLAMAALLERRAFLILLFVSLAGAAAVGMLRNGWSAWIGPRTPGAVTPAGDRRIRIGPATLCAALLYAGGFYG